MNRCRGPICKCESELIRVRPYVVKLVKQTAQATSHQPGLLFQVVGKSSVARKTNEAYRRDAVLLRDSWTKMTRKLEFSRGRGSASLVLAGYRACTRYVGMIWAEAYPRPCTLY